MDTKKEKSVGYKLRSRGFDLTRFDRSSGYYQVRCSQCNPLVIQGVTCHGTGCPNERAAKKRR